MLSLWYLTFNILCPSWSNSCLFYHSLQNSNKIEVFVAFCTTSMLFHIRVFAYDIPFVWVKATLFSRMTKIILILQSPQISPNRANLISELHSQIWIIYFSYKVLGIFFDHLVDTVSWHHLKYFLKHRFQGPIPHLQNQNLWGWAQESAF